MRASAVNECGGTRTRARPEVLPAGQRPDSRAYHESREALS